MNKFINVASSYQRLKATKVTPRLPERLRGSVARSGTTLKTIHSLEAINKMCHSMEILPCNTECKQSVVDT